MDKWEYKIYNSASRKYAENYIEQDLNWFGQQGWELVSGNGQFFYFKRRIPS